MKASAMSSLEGRLVKMREGDPGSVYFVVTVADSVMEGEQARLRRIHPQPREDVGFVSVDKLEVCSFEEYRIGDFLSHLAVQSLAHMSGGNGLSMRAGATIFKPFQFRPLLSYLDNPRRRILIADEVGLGKTISAIYIMIEEMARSPMDRVAIICPASLKLKWRRELWFRFGLHFDIKNGRGFLESLRGGHRFRCIVSMDAMRRRMDQLMETISGSSPIDMIIVDEAHHLIGRGGDTIRREFVQMLSFASKRVIGLTATPIHLEPMDLGRILDVIDPMDTGSEAFLREMDIQSTLNQVYRLLSQKDFDKEDFHASKRIVDDVLSQVGDFDGFRQSAALAMLPESLTEESVSTVEGRTSLRRLVRDAGPLCGRVSRSRRIEVGECRERVPVEVRIDLDDSIRTAVQNGKEVQVSELSLFREVDALLEDSFSHVHRRQLASSLPAMIGLLESGIEGFRVWTKEGSNIPEEELGLMSDDERQGWTLKSQRLSDTARQRCKELADKYSLLPHDTKFRILMNRLRELRDNGQAKKAIVFTHWRPTIDHLISASSRHRDITSFGVSWKNSPEQTEVTMSRFQRHEGFAVLFTGDVLAEGLDIQAADCVVNYDLPYNPQRIEQRIGRVDRIGQESDRITILNLIVKGSTDEMVLDTLLNRIGIFENYIGDMPPTLAKTWSSEDLVDSERVVVEIEHLEDIGRIREHDAIRGLDDVLDEETVDLYDSKRHEFSRLRLLVLRDFFEMLLGEGATQIVSWEPALLRIAGLTREDAEAIGRILPMGVADSIRRKISVLLGEDGDILLSSDPGLGDWYIPLMHPLMDAAKRLVERHYSGDIGEMPVESVETGTPLPGLPEDTNGLAVSEHTYVSDWGSETKWMWWRLERGGLEASRLDAVDIMDFAEWAHGLQSNRTSADVCTKTLSDGLVEAIKKAHQEWLDDLRLRTRSQFLTSKEAEKERTRIQMWRIEKALEDDPEEDIRSALSLEMNRMREANQHLEIEIGRAREGSYEGLSVQDRWRPVLVVLRT